VQLIWVLYDCSTRFAVKLIHHEAKMIQMRAIQNTWDLNISLRKCWLQNSDFDSFVAVVLTIYCRMAAWMFLGITAVEKL